MKKKSNILKGFFATASLCGTLFASSNTLAATILTTGDNVSLNTGAGLVGGVFNDGDIIQIEANTVPTPIISADKPNAQISEITTLINALVFGGVEVSQNTSIGPLNAADGLDPNFGPLKFIADNVTTTITGVGNQTFSTIDFAGHDSTLQINDGLAIATTIDNSGAADNGTVNIGNGVSVTKDIGATASLLAVNINGSGNISLGGIVNANTITVANAAANATVTGIMSGNLNYTAAGTITAQGVAGNVDFTDNAGTLILSGNYDNIGVFENAANATVQVINTLVAFGDTSLGNVGNIIIGDDNSSAVLESPPLINFTGNLIFGTKGGGLKVDNNSTISGKIINGANATFTLDGNLLITDPSAGTVNEIDIADKVTYTIDAANGNVDLLNNGAKIVFEGQSSILNLVNTGNTDQKFTLYANLNPSSTTDNYGVVTVEATTNGLTIANNGGPYTIGQDNTHRSALIVSGGGNITIDNTVFVSVLEMQSTAQVTFNQLLDLGVNGKIMFVANGTLVVNGVTGSIITSAPNQGILKINSGNISGTIGDATNSLNLVNIGAGASSFGGEVYAGSVVLTDEASELTLDNDVIVNSDLTTIAGDGSGKLIFAQDGTVTGNVGAAGAALAEIVFNGVDNIGGAANATTFTVANVGADATVTGIMTGNLNYTAAGTVTAQGVAGNVDFTDNAGTLILSGNYDNTGVFDNAANATVQLAKNALVTLGDSSFGNVGNIIIGNDNGTATLYANNVINFTGNLAFGTEGGMLLVGNNNVQISGKIINGAKATFDVSANLTISDPSAGSVNKVDISNNRIYTIDAANGNVDLLNNGAKIVFEGVDSQLALINSSDQDDRTFTLYANLNPSDAEDNYGIVRVGATTNGLTIANNGGPYTIGQDNTHRLQNFIVDGAGNIVVDNTVFTKLLSMNSTGQVTFNQALDLGEDGNIAFGANGTLVVNGVTGSVTTSAPNQGILTINSGNVSGTIGDATNNLNLVNIGANPVTFLANVFADAALTDNVSVLTLAAGVTLNGAVTTANNTKGILSLGVGSSVTGGIGTNGMALEKVQVGAGASSFGGEVYAGAVVLTDEASELTLDNDVIVNSDITTTAGDKSGKLIFAQDGTVTGNVGAAGAALTEIVFNGVDNIEGAANATTFTVANAAANATVTGPMTGNAVYTAAGKLTSTGNFTGDVDFQNKAGTFTLGNNSTITGAVTSTGGVAGTLNFAGNGSVTENIGTDAGNSPALISVQGDNTTSVSLDDDVFVGGINFTNGGKLQLSGNLTTPNIDFGANGGTLEFNGNGQYTLSSTITNGENGILNVLATLTATDSTIGTLKTINIGKTGTKQTFTIKVNNPNFVLLSTANSNINFGTNDSELVITAPVEQTITFDNNLKGFAGGGGILFLDGSTEDLTVSGNNGTTLGTAGNTLAALNIKGYVTITDNLDVQNINQLNIKSGADFTDQSLTSAQIAIIKIGEAGEGGDASYSLDATGRNFDLNTKNMTFANQDSSLDIENSSNANDSTITLTGPLDPGNDKFGIVELSTGNKNLTIDNGGNAAYTLGTEDHNLKQLIFYSDGTGTINLNVEINVESIILDIPTIKLNVVDADIYFEDDTVYTATGNINGNIDFQDNAGVINLADGVQINGIVTSTNGVNGTLNFEGTGEVTDLITGIAMLRAGAGDVSLTASGDYSITEIQGNGNNNLTFAKDTNLDGGINITGGQAVNLIFTNGGSVSSSIGEGAAVGNIAVQAGTVNFGSTVNSGNIIVSNGATVQVNNNVTATDISGNNDNSGTLKLNNPAPINITGTIGANNTLGTVEVANSDATIIGGLNAQNINFSNAGKAATLTLGGASNVTNVTTAGNNIHTLAVTDLMTNGAIGSEDHRLKAIELTGNGLVTIANNFYSGVTTANDGQGNVKFSVDGAISYDLGDANAKLASVQFSENSTVKGDIYAGDINIDAGKTATFERGNNNLNPKTLNVPDAIVDGTPLPRSLQVLTYLTDIKANNFNFADATAAAKFKDAVLIDTPINNGGTIKFSQNAWLKGEVNNVQQLEFSPNTFAILEQNIQAGTLVADQANLILLDDIEINANLNVRDVILDLANYELKHTGNVTYNGLLTVITYYDTTLKTGGHVLVGNGASVDMSGVDNVIIKIKSRSDITKITNGEKHQVVALEAGATFVPAPQNKVTIDSTDEANRWVKWVSDNTGLTLIADDGTGGGDSGGGGDDNGGGGNAIIPEFDPTPIIDDTKDSPVASGIADQLIKYVTGFGNTSDAGKLLNDLGLMPSSSVSETLDRLGERTNTKEPTENTIAFNGLELEDILIDVSVNIDNLTAEGIEGRLEDVGGDALSGLNEPTSTLNNNSGENRRGRTPVAAGDGDEDNIGTGVWGVPFYGKATQKSKNGASGYKSSTSGGIVGFDYALNNSVVLGAAYTRADSKLRHQNDKVGDRTKAVSDVFSVYGLYNWPQNNCFIEGIASYGRTSIKNHEKRMTSTGDQTAIGKFTNISYTGELLGGYNYLMPNLTTVTPMLGVRYATFKNNGYTEKGTTFQNLSVRKNSYNKFAGIIGLKGTTNFLVQDIILKPELHGFINYDFKRKTPNIDAYLNGIDEPLTTIRFKPARVLYNLGCGISTKYNRMEFGIRYNLSMAKKYTANQGSLKIKVNL